MKKYSDKIEIVNKRDEILDEMMKNPGVSDCMEILNKYSQITIKYNSYFKIMYQYYKNRSIIQTSCSTL